MAQELERPERLLLVDLADREADVDDDVVAELDLRDVGQAGLLADAAEVDLAHPQAGVVADLDDLAGDAEAHGAFLLRRDGRWRRRPRSGGCHPRGGDGRLAIADPAVVDRDLVVDVDVEAVARPAAAASVVGEAAVLEDAARQADGARARSRAGPRRTSSRVTAGDRLLEARPPAGRPARRRRRPRAAPRRVGRGS